MPDDINHPEHRSIRDGFLRVCPEKEFSGLVTDEGLSRLSSARNAASKSANLFMVIAALIAALYFLRLEGLAGEIKIGEYKLSALPFGVFVLCASVLALSCVSLVRTGDSRSYDRLLRLACEQRHKGKDAMAYHLFPNEHAWGEPLSRMAHAAQGGAFSQILRGVSLLFINAFTLMLILLPAACGIDFLYNDRVVMDKDFQFIRWYFILFLLISNVSSVLLVFWANAIDRE
jgi:hypothetical protein